VAGVELPTCIHPEAEVFLGPVKMAKYVTPGDTRLGESIKPFIKESNTILLGNHGVVCYGPDLEDAYYKLEIVDAYSRILLLVKQLGSVQPLGGPEMKELLDLKKRFGMYDPRIGENVSPEKLVCAGNDYVSRVRNEVGNKGRMATASGTAPVSKAGETSALERAVQALAPGNYTDSEVEQLVQTITDQIMATASV
jgi:L-fuculose-phosphate aldolase